jgi:Uma2 family endonuclease
MSVSKRDNRYHTYADYLVWSNTHGDELIDGAAYVREPPSPSPSHQWITFELARQIAAALEDSGYQVYVAPLDVRLPKSAEADDLVDTVVQPDILIVSALQRVDARGVRGAPDWLAEVLSRSTARHDKLVKIPVYERAGVREVWLIDPEARIASLYRLEGGRYGSPVLVPLVGQTRLTAVPGVTVDWDRLLARMR